MNININVTPGEAEKFLADYFNQKHGCAVTVNLMMPRNRDKDLVHELRKIQLIADQPARKIEAIKALRTLVKDMTGEMCGLGYAKNAIENFDHYIQYASEKNGFPLCYCNWEL